jgi:hypothetical protein
MENMKDVLLVRAENMWGCTYLTLNIPEECYRQIIHMMAYVNGSRDMMVAACAKLCHRRQVFHEFVYEWHDVRFRLQISKTCNVQPELFKFADGVDQLYSIALYSMTPTNVCQGSRAFSCRAENPPVDVDDLQ